MKATVLLPFDGSRSAFRALEHAIERSKSNPIIVHLLNVEPPLVEYGMVRAYLSPDRHREATAERARAVLEPAVAQLEKEQVPHVAHVVWGDVATTIDRVAHELDCDSIVMGSRGLGPVASVLNGGSTSTRLVHLTRLPVTIVR